MASRISCIKVRSGIDFCLPTHRARHDGMAMRSMTRICWLAGCLVLAWGHAARAGAIHTAAKRGNLKKAASLLARSPTLG